MTFEWHIVNVTWLLVSININSYLCSLNHVPIKLILTSRTHTMSWIFWLKRSTSINNSFELSWQMFIGRFYIFTNCKSAWTKSCNTSKSFGGWNKQSNRNTLWIMIVLMDENASTPKQVNVFSSVFVLVHYQPHKSLPCSTIYSDSRGSIDLIIFLLLGNSWSVFDYNIFDLQNFHRSLFCKNFQPNNQTKTNIYEG